MGFDIIEINLVLFRVSKYLLKTMNLKCNIIQLLSKSQKQHFSKSLLQTTPTTRGVSDLFQWYFIDFQEKFLFN